MLRQSVRRSDALSMRSGWAYRARQLRDGRRQIFEFLLPGDLAMLPAADQAAPFGGFIRSLTAVEACAFNFSELMNLYHSAPAQDFIHSAQVYCDRISRQDDAIIDLGRRNAMERVASLLLGLERRLEEKELSSNGRFSFPLRQEHLADALGLTVAHVNRTLTRLRTDKLIRYGDGSMEIDRASIEQLLA